MSDSNKELRTLLRQAPHYLGGRVGVILLGFVSFPLFTRLFSVADYGVMSLVAKVVATVTVLANLGIQNSVVRFYHEHTSAKEPGALRRYFSTFLIGTMAIAAAVTAIFMLITWGLPVSLVSLPLKKLFILASLLIFTRAVSSILSGFLRVEEKTTAFNVLDVASKALMIVAVCALFFGWQRSVWAFFAGSILVDLLQDMGIIVYFFHRRLLSLGIFDSVLFKGALTFGAPLIVYELGFMILDSGDRILVQHYLGAEPLGYYSAAYNMASYFLEALMVPLNLALFPIFMRLWVNKGKEETQAFLSRVFDVFLGGSIGLIATMILLKHDLLVVLASSKFRAADSLLPSLLIGVLFYALVTLVNPGLLIFKKTQTMARLIIYSAILNVVMNIVLLPRIGLQGAAIATLVSYLFFFLLTMHASFKLLPFAIEGAAILRYVLAAGLTVAILFKMDLGNAFLNVGTKGLLGLLIYLAILFLIDPRVRELAGKVNWPGARQQNQPAVAAAIEMPRGGKN
jgi:O-antigen/teichoic acid export membrane protein